jgi:hypothetical protein
MAGFNSYDQIINALTTNGAGQDLQFSKQNGIGAAAVAGNYYDMWKYVGNPEPGTAPGTGAYWTTLQATDAGGLAYSNAAAGKYMHAISLGLNCTAATSMGNLFLVDRLGFYTISGGASSPFNILGTTPAWSTIRGGMADSEPGVLACFVNNIGSATTATSPSSVFFTYTNSTGVGSRQSGTATLSGGTAIPNSRFLHTSLFIPLATGDVGIKSIQSVSFGGTWCTTNIQLVLFKIIASIPSMTQYAWTERDLVLHTPRLPRIFNDAHLSMLYHSASAVASGGVFNGQVFIASN